ncbi:wolframin ER transmembrane glycoprotein wfs1 [Oratosquilla oratoria]|uniref:wolframin ER transmembrane glycoprotein wfs1 n=1 Tax=Oratosquilla oratoria TaxID=337810 RepID=UPI003F770686
MSTSCQQEQTSCTKTSRRRWSVQDGPKGLLRRMRSQLAEDGCPESQRVLAKVLLDQYAENGEEETARQAVFWFTQASLQGDSEATDILQQCLEDNIGISQHNFHDVRACLQMPVGEKLARRAARLLFHSLNDGADFITSGQLRQHIAQVYRQQKQQEEWKETNSDNKCKESSCDTEAKDNILKSNTLDDSNGQGLEEKTVMEDLKASEKVSEDRLVATAVCYHQGQLPPLHFTLFSNLKDKWRTFKLTISKSGWILLWWLWLVILHHYQTALRFWVSLTHKIAMGAGWPSSYHCVVGIILVFGLISLVCVLPVGLIVALLVYSSLACLILITCRLLMHRHDFSNLQIWSHVFRHHCPHLDVAAAEWQYEKREWQTYVAAVPVLVIFLSGLALSPSVKVNVVPVAVVMTTLTLFTLNHRILYWPLISFSMYSLAHVPSLNQYIFDYLQVNLPNQFLGMTWILEEHPVAAFGNLNIYVGVGPLLHIMWIVVLIVVAVREKKVLKMLPPHLVCLSWCHIALVTMDEVTSWQTLLSSCALLILLALLPLLSVVLAYIGPALILGGILHQAGVGGHIVVVTVIVSIVLPFVISWWWEKMVKVIQQLLSLIFLLFLLWPHFNIGMKTAPSTSLTWDLYKNNCLPPTGQSLNNNNMAVTMIRCHPLVGSHVKWQATVAMVTLESVDNKVETVTSWLPKTLTQPVRCLLGRKNDKCAKDKLSEEEHRQCLLLQIAHGPESCSLEAWNSYNFALDLSMESINFWKFNGLNSDVRVYAEHRFHQFALSLAVKDVVQFTGILEEGLGSSQVIVRAISMKCVTCKKNPPPVLPLVYNHSAEVATIGRFLFSFFLGPTLSIEPPKGFT